MSKRFTHDAIIILLMSVNLFSLCISARVMDKFLLVSDGGQEEILQVSLATSTVEAVGLQGNHKPVAIAYDPLDNMVFWSDNRAGAISAVTLGGAHEKPVMVLSNVFACDCLAADYINRLLFFTDTGKDVIGVVSMHNYQLFTYIITEYLDQPLDIVVSPKQGIMYWSDGGAAPRIETSNMDGSKRQTLVAFPKALPVGLALDLQENQLFWADTSSNTIKVMDLNSHRIRKLFREPRSDYFGLDVIGNYLYITDWKKNYLLRVYKEGGRPRRFGPAIFHRVNSITGYDSSELIRGISVCVTSECEHLCLPKVNNQYSCRCAEGYISQGPQCKKQSSSGDDVMTSESSSGDDVMTSSSGEIVMTSSSGDDMMTSESSSGDDVMTSESSSGDDMMTSSSGEIVMTSESSSGDDVMTSEEYTLYISSIISTFLSDHKIYDNSKYSKKDDVKGSSYNGTWTLK